LLKHIKARSRIWRRHPISPRLDVVRYQQIQAGPRGSM
jgi:hypothetical protein